MEKIAFETRREALNYAESLATSAGGYVNDIISNTYCDDIAEVPEGHEQDFGEIPAYQVIDKNYDLIALVGWFE